MHLEKYLLLIKSKAKGYDNDIKIHNIEYIIEYKNSAGKKLTMSHYELMKMNVGIVLGNKKEYDPTKWKYQ